MSPRQTITLDAGEMTRLAEVVGYADRRGLSIAHAVIQLINIGLSDVHE